MKQKTQGEMENTLFEMELEKLPRIMRMTPRKKCTLRILFYSFTAVELLIITLFPRWYGAAYDVYRSGSGKYYVNDMIPSGYISAIIIGLIPFVPLLLYCLFVYLLERTAYSNARCKATDIAENRRLYTREKDYELIRKLNKDDTTGLVHPRIKKEDPSLEEEIDHFFNR